MCGIVGAVAQRNVSSILIEGLRRLEYRGYDSAGAALINGDNLERYRSLGKVQELAEKFKVEEDEQYVSPYAHLEKAAVLQEAR